MEADPYDGYVELVEALLGSARERASHAESSNVMEVIAEESVSDIESSLFEFAGGTWRVRAEFEKNLGQQDEVAFRSLDSMIGFVHAIATLLGREGHATTRQPPDVVCYVVSALNVKATSVAHEICAMLRAGFPIGAHARWRTLYEVDVIAHVLLRGNRGTAARFVNHRWVQMARDNERAPVEWPDSEPSPEAMKNKFVRRYGKSFGGTHGWAAELTKRKLGVERPNLAHLERIADLNGHNRRVYAAHHGVHADSLGILQLVDMDDIFHSGARTSGTAAGCLQTVRVLGEINDALLAMWHTYTGSPTIDLLRYLNDEVSLTLQRDISFHSWAAHRETIPKDEGERAPQD